MYFKNRTNHSIINILNVTASLSHNKPAAIYLIKNGTLSGVPNFIEYDSTSCSLIDKDAINVTFDNNRQLLWTGLLAQTGNIDFKFENEFSIQPGEKITLAVSLLSGNGADLLGSINTLEDQ